MDSKLTSTQYSKARLLAVRVWGAIGVAILFVLTIQGLGYLTEALQLLLAGMIMGFICSPVTNWLEDKGVKRGLAAFLALLLFIVIIWGGLSLLVPSFVDQSLSLAKSIPDYVTKIQDNFNEFYANLGGSTDSHVQQSMEDFMAGFSAFATDSSKQVITKLSTGILTNLISTINVTVIFFLGVVLAYWFAKDYPKIVKEMAVIMGPSHQDAMLLLLAVLSRSMGGYMRGVAIMSVIDGSLSYLGFLLIGHPYAGLMGVIIGCLHFIPVVGPWLSSAFAALVALFVSPWLAVETLMVIVIVQNITDNLIGPLVMQSAVKVHPILSLVAIAIGASLGGVIGMTLAIPLSAAIKGVFVYYFESHTNRQIVSESGALFKSKAFVDEEGNILPAFDALDDAKFFETSRLVVEPDISPEVVEHTEIKENWLVKCVKALQTQWKSIFSCKNEE